MTVPPLRSMPIRPTNRVPVREFAASPVCLGAVGDPRIVGAAFEAAINFFFIFADLHWPLYESLRVGLRDLFSVRSRRDEVIVAAASYATQPEFCDEPFSEVLWAVPGLERLEILVAGGAYGHELPQRLCYYKRNRDQGRYGAKAIGATFHDRKACSAHIQNGKIDLAFARYNARHAGAITDLFPFSTTAFVPLFCFTATRGWVPPTEKPPLFAHIGLSIAEHYRFALSPKAVQGLPRVRHHLARPAARDQPRTVDQTPASNHPASRA